MSETWNLHKRLSGCMASHTRWCYCCPWLPQIIIRAILRFGSLDRSVAIVTGHGLNSQQVKIFLLSTVSRLALGCNGYWGMKLTINLHLVPKSRMVEPYLSSPICPHGIMFNWLSTGTTLYHSFYHLYLSCWLGSQSPRGTTTTLCEEARQQPVYPINMSQLWKHEFSRMTGTVHPHGGFKRCVWCMSVHAGVMQIKPV
jgi:hypothetical protein